MKPSELLSDFDFGPGDTRTALLQFRLQMAYLADHVYTAELADGGRVHDAMDFRQWLVELSEAARELAKAAVNPHRLLLAQDSGSRTKVTCRSPQPRYSADLTCNRCGHVHEGTGECGVSMGKDRICRCELEVSA